MDLKENSAKNRIYSFDIMRIIAICAVILLHISADYVKSFPNNSLDFISNNLLNSLTRFAVPTFFMISGALMLNEDKKLSTKKILHAAGNLFILLIVWSVFYSISYYVIKPLVFNEDIAASAIFFAVYNGHYHMWYLFVLIGLYLITPILRTFIKRENLPLITVYLVLSIVIRFCVPFIDELIYQFTSWENLLSDYIAKYRIDYIYEYITYYIAGWYILTAEIKNHHRITLYVGGLLGYLGTFVLTQLFFDNTHGESNFFYANNSLNVFLYSIGMFTFLHHIFKNKNFLKTSIISKISSFVFGVYIIHPVFLFVFKTLFRNIGHSPLETLIIFFSATATSFLSVFAISKIPVIKKLIRG